MDMAQPYTLGAAAYANIAIGRSRCPAASKALHGLSTWRASRSTAQSASVSCPYPDGPRVCLRDQSYGFRRYREQPPDTSSIPAELSSDCPPRSEEHTSELQSLMRISYADFCL